MNKFLLFLLCGMFCLLSATAKITPISLQQRTAECQYLVMGEVVHSTSYWDSDHHNIYTLYEIRIDGYWKGQNAATHIGLVDLGGTVGDHYQVTNPAVRLAVGDYGVFMLGNQLPTRLQSPVHSSLSSHFIQAFPTASIQGAILEKNGIWMDPSAPDKLWTTKGFIEKLTELCHQDLINARGEKINTATISNLQVTKSANKTLAVTTLQNGNLVTTSVFNSGVSNNAPYEMIINGSGFGATAGTITFPDADAGGGANTFTFPGTGPAQYSDNGAPSDIISWTNTQIRIRIPPGAGTGTMEVFNASNVSQGTAAITIDWALLATYSTFSGFASETSQFNKLVNADGTGGYTFKMSSGGSANFFTNAAAKAALKRSIDTWRCGSSVNFNLDLGAATAAGYTSDGESVVLFDNSLPTGVLGRATTRTTGTANGLCNMHNTFRRISEIDIQFPTLPAAGFTWNFNSSGTTASQYNFETVSLHEIGHGHGMGHVVASNKVMHYSISNGTQNVNLNASDIAAGTYKVNNSTGLNCIVIPTPMIVLVNPCGPLPMELLSFTVTAVSSNNEVRWITTHEKEIAQYEVENSLDGIEFVKLGALAASMKGSENKYVFVHTNPQTNVNYYRLKMVDRAGKISYSQIISVIRKDGDDFSIAPNPTSGDVTINVTGMPLQGNKLAYSIKDLNGRVLIQRAETVNDRTARFTERMNNLPAAVYFIQLSINGKTSTQKIVKQ